MGLKVHYFCMSIPLQPMLMLPFPSYTWQWPLNIRWSNHLKSCWAPLWVLSKFSRFFEWWISRTQPSPALLDIKGHTQRTADLVCLYFDLWRSHHYLIILALADMKPKIYFGSSSNTLTCKHSSLQHVTLQTGTECAEICCFHEPGLQASTGITSPLVREKLYLWRTH